MRCGVSLNAALASHASHAILVRYNITFFSSTSRQSGKRPAPHLAHLRRQRGRRGQRRRLGISSYLGRGGGMSSRLFPSRVCNGYEIPRRGIDETVGELSAADHEAMTTERRRRP
nr:hypothetical protein CFP56_13055 [Quercus suber]